jgi:hypothetical protein
MCNSVLTPDLVKKANDRLKNEEMMSKVVESAQKPRKPAKIESAKLNEIAVMTSRNMFNHQQNTADEPINHFPPIAAQPRRAP